MMFTRKKKALITRAVFYIITYLGTVEAPRRNQEGPCRVVWLSSSFRRGELRNQQGQ